MQTPLSWAMVGPVVMLIASNVFMTFAWYGQLKVEHRPIWLIVLISWGIAFFEYCLVAPANRLGRLVYEPAELKAMQEVITLAVFVVFSITFLGERLTANHAIGFLLIAAGAVVVFKGPF